MPKKSRANCTSKGMHDDTGFWIGSPKVTGTFALHLARGVRWQRTGTRL